MRSDKRIRDSEFGIVTAGGSQTGQVSRGGFIKDQAGSDSKLFPYDNSSMTNAPNEKVQKPKRVVRRGSVTKSMIGRPAGDESFDPVTINPALLPELSSPKGGSFEQERAQTRESGRIV